MTPKGRKRNHVNNYSLEDGTGHFVGNPSQAKEFYNTFHPGKKVYVTYDEDCHKCFYEVEL